jgi:hypothetical protein
MQSAIPKILQKLRLAVPEDEHPFHRAKGHAAQNGYSSQFGYFRRKPMLIQPAFLITSTTYPIEYE